MKKFISIILILATLILSLTSCKGEEPPESTFVNDRFIFQLDNNVLKRYDLVSRTVSVACPDPLCEHGDECPVTNISGYTVTDKYVFLERGFGGKRSMMLSVYDIDYDSGAVKAEPFINAAINSRAAVAIIAHNHPYGPPFPTVGDKATNNMMAEALTRSGVLLAEHYVVSGKKFVGFMNNLTMAFSQYSDVERFFESKRRDG